MKSANKGDTVKVHYSCKLDDGNVIFTNFDKESVQIKIGENTVFQELEDALIGMKKGESKTIKVLSEKAFGKYDEKLIITINKKDA